ncbi:MAG: transposase [Planctomycetota bacterium]|jgi:REP element-mobilizing transposase RayT
MGETYGYMVTWTTYGSWLQGDERGFVKKGEVLGASKGLKKHNRRRRKGNGVKLKKSEREVARRAMLAEAERIGEKILALSVWSNHVHVVIGEGGKPIGKVVSRLKSAANYALWERGIDGRMWTRGYDKRFCFDERALKDRMAYVMRQKE